MPLPSALWPDVLDEAREEDLTQGLQHVQDMAVSRPARKRGVPSRDKPYLNLSDSEDANQERLASNKPSLRSASGQSLEYKVTASLLSLSSGHQSGRRSGSTGPRSSDDRQSSGSSAAPRTSSSSSKQSTPNSSGNRRGLSLPNLPQETLTEEDDNYESAVEDISCQVDTSLEEDITPLSTRTIEQPNISLESTQSLEVLEEDVLTDSSQVLDPIEFPYTKNMGAASLVYTHNRNSSLLRQATSFFSFSPGMEMRSSTINILGNGQTLQEAASEDEGYMTARSSVSSNFCPPQEYTIQLPKHFEPIKSKLHFHPTASPYQLSANPHELRKEYRKSLREKNLSLPTHLSIPSTRSSPPRQSTSTPSSPVSDISSDANASDTFLPRPRQTVVQINPVPTRGDTFDSSASSVDLFKWVPNRIRVVPPNAILFVAGFLFFPCFWIGAFYPSLEAKDKEPWRDRSRNSQLSTSNVVTEEKVRRYSWRGQHEGVLPSDSLSPDALPGLRRLSGFLNPDPRIKSPSYWANQKAIYVWRTRCRIMSLLSIFLLVAIIVAAALSSKHRT